MLFAQRQDIRNASNIIEEVEDVVMNFKSYAEKWKSMSTGYAK